MVRELRELPPSTWLRAVPFGLLAALVIAVPSDLLDNPIFGRPVPPRSIDYAILAVTAGLIGLILAIRPPQSDGAWPTSDPDRGAHPAAGRAIAEAIDRQDNRTLWGGFVSFLAVGCPVCNQAVVALLGTSGALSWWAPVQPVVGLAAVGLLLYTLRLRLTTYRLEACPVPARTA